jgi:hypothetical protein
MDKYLRLNHERDKDIIITSFKYVVKNVLEKTEEAFKYQNMNPIRISGLL